MKNKNMIVYLITAGTGRDGDEWYIEQAYTTKGAAERQLTVLKVVYPLRGYNPIEELEVTTE